ncbi:MAG TPA: metallophosphoesterase [Terriglobales bacterium]
MFFIVFLLLWAGLHVYVLFRLHSVPFIAHHVPTPLLVSIGVFLGASYIVSRVLERFEIDSISHVLEYIGANWVGVFFLIFVTLFAVDVFTAFGFLFRAHIPMLRTYALAVAGILSIIAAVQAWRTPVVTEYEVTMPNLPREADGTVLVVASDMHLGSMLGRSWATERAAQFDSLKPDMILLVGDIFEGDETTHARWLPVLQRIRAPHGVYVVTGNHELYAGPQKILELFNRAGYRVLRDESVEPIPGLVLTGVDDLAFHGRPKHAAAVEHTLMARPVGATVLLSHTPIQTDKASKLGVNLMLSGHTHEGQIWPFMYLVRRVFPITSGRYNVNGMTAIVCRGTGTWGPRMRLWKRSELLRITLRAPHRQS